MPKSTISFEVMHHARCDQCGWSAVFQTERDIPVLCPRCRGKGTKCVVCGEQSFGCRECVKHDPFL